MHQHEKYDVDEAVDNRHGGQPEDDDDEDTIEDDMVELSRGHAQACAEGTHCSQRNNPSQRGEMISQRMELQSRIIKDQVFGSQHNLLQQDNRGDDADSATIYEAKDKLKTE